MTEPAGGGKSSLVQAYSLLPKFLIVLKFITEFSSGFNIVN
jgi:hypothetical protein